MIKNKFLIIIVFSLLSINTQAGGKIYIPKITSIGFNSGGLYIYGHNTTNANNNCTDSTAVVLKDSDPN